MNLKKKMAFKPEICCGPYEKSLLKHLLFDYEQQSRYYEFVSSEFYPIQTLYLYW